MHDRPDLRDGLHCKCNSGVNYSFHVQVSRRRTCAMTGVTGDFSSMSLLVDDAMGRPTARTAFTRWNNPGVEYFS